jgi:hypothetical protein
MADEENGEGMGEGPEINGDPELLGDSDPASSLPGDDLVALSSPGLTDPVGIAATIIPINIG